MIEESTNANSPSISRVVGLALSLSRRSFFIPPKRSTRIQATCSPSICGVFFGAFFQTGEVPRNPEQYCGSPFVHDIQVAFLSAARRSTISNPLSGRSCGSFRTRQPAGWFMYAYSRHAGMTELARPRRAGDACFWMMPPWRGTRSRKGPAGAAGVAVRRGIQRGRWSQSAVDSPCDADPGAPATLRTSLIGAPLRLAYEHGASRRVSGEIGPHASTVSPDYGEPARVSEPPPPADVRRSAGG